MNDSQLVYIDYYFKNIRVIYCTSLINAKCLVYKYLFILSHDTEHLIMTMIKTLKDITEYK